MYIYSVYHHAKCNLLISVLSLRSLSELEGIRVGGETSEKIRQVTERATLFRITSNAMINVRQLHVYF